MNCVGSVYLMPTCVLCFRPIGPVVHVHLKGALHISMALHLSVIVVLSAINSAGTYRMDTMQYRVVYESTIVLTRPHLHQRFALFHSSTFSGSPEKALLKATISAEVRQCRGIGGKRIFVHDLPRLTGEIHIFWLNTHQHTTRTCTCHRVYTSYPCGNTG